LPAADEILGRQRPARGLRSAWRCGSFEETAQETHLPTSCRANDAAVQRRRVAPSAATGGSPGGWLPLGSPGSCSVGIVSAPKQRFTSRSAFVPLV
jgi:hypothetical protein